MIVKNCKKGEKNSINNNSNNNNNGGKVAYVEMCRLYKNSVEQTILRIESMSVLPNNREFI